MKAIKARAKKALQSYDHTIYYHCSELTEDSFVEGYVQGAIEQKAIDDKELCKRFEQALNGQKQKVIEKACEWLMKQYVEDDMDMVSASAFINDFRKAMEE